MNFNFNYNNCITVTGLNESLINEYILNYKELNNKNILIVTDTLYSANNIYKGLNKLIDNVYFFPMDDFATVLAIASSPDLKVARIDTLNNIGYNGKNAYSVGVEYPTFAIVI